MSGPEASDIDRGLIESIRLTREHHRTNSVRKLVRTTSTDFQELEASNASLRKENKALQNRLRRAAARRPTKAKLGFKQKTDKSTVQIDTNSNKSQTVAIKKSKLKSV